MTKKLGPWPMSGVNQFSREGQGKIHHDVISKQKNSTIDRENLYQVIRLHKGSGLKKKLIFWMIWKSQCTQYVERIWITFRGGLQHQQVGLILIMSGQKESFLHLSRTSIKNFLKRILKIKISKHMKTFYYRWIILS